MAREIEYKEQGVVRDTINAVVMLFIGIGVLVLVIILISVIGAKAYDTTRLDIRQIAYNANSPNDFNGVGLPIVQDINETIKASFSSFADGTGFIGIIVLALVFFLVLLLLRTGMGGFGGTQAF